MASPHSSPPSSPSPHGSYPPSVPHGKGVTKRSKPCSLEDLEAALRDKKKLKTIEASFSLTQLVNMMTANQQAATSRSPEVQEAIGDIFFQIRQLLSPEDYRSLSSITADDEKSLGVLDMGFLNIDRASFVPVELCPQAKYMLQIVLQRWSVAQGCRTMIDLFLLDALHKKDDTMAIFPEYKIAGYIPGFKLKLGGAVDYLGADTGVIQQKKRFDRLRQGRIEVPHLVVIEAKKEDTFVAGITQLLAEMKVIWSQHPEKAKKPVYGVLTSGLLWRFFLLEADGTSYYCTMKTETSDFDFQEDEGVIVGLLVSFMRHTLPAGVTTNSKTFT